MDSSANATTTFEVFIRGMDYHIHMQIHEGLTGSRDKLRNGTRPVRWCRLVAGALVPDPVSTCCQSWFLALISQRERAFPLDAFFGVRSRLRHLPF
jgi:hypothetical protein